jgi:hypothetical protein
VAKVTSGNTIPPWRGAAVETAPVSAGTIAFSGVDRIAVGLGKNERRENNKNTEILNDTDSFIVAEIYL